MFKYENGISSKLDSFTNSVINYKRLTKNRIPSYQWYVLFNELIKPFGIKQYENFKKKMQIISDRCTNCNLCVNVCERNAWIENEKMPDFRVNNCEFCLECVHKCPTEAIIFSNKMKNKPRLNKKFFNKLKKEITNAQHCV